MKAIVGALMLIVTSYAVAAGQNSPQALVGSWNYDSMTNLKDGKPSGTVHFKPGQWTIALNPDGSWARSAPIPAAKPQAGTYKVHKNDLILKHNYAASDDKYEFELKNDGKTLTLTNKDTIYQATRQIN
jgi:hypothetical protein